MPTKQSKEHLNNNKAIMIGGVKTIDHNDVSPGLLMLDSYNGGYECHADTDGSIKTEPADLMSGGRTYITLDKGGWQGSTTTIIEERTLPVAVLEDFNNQHYVSRPETPVTSTRGPGRRPGRRSAKAESEDEASSPEEAERLKVRRERNKEAAARCRKRKMDQIETLEKQVADWEAKNIDLQRKMKELKEEKDAVTFMLENHDCQKTYHNNQQQQQHLTATTQGYQLPPLVNINTHPCTTTNQSILRVPNVPAPIVTFAPTTILTTSEKALATATGKVAVKAESTDEFAYPSSVHSTTEEMLHNTEPQAPLTLNNFQEESHYLPIAKKSRRSRPESLSLQVCKPQNYRSIVGVTIETPTSIFTTPSFEALMDGRTGLTPTNVLTPVSITMSALTTPVLNSPTCSLQQRNNAPNSNGKSFELKSL